MMELSVNINSKNKNYPIYITSNKIENLKESILESINYKNYIVVVSKKVFDLYSEILKFPKDKIFILKDGEIEKNYKNYLKILDFAFSKKLKREDSIVAIGGGVVGDLAGFVASTYMRGVNFVQVPTTLLAMTDSSVGGKVAINNKFGKNLVGAFYQPKAVFINVNFLKTLDIKQFKSGLGEVIKYSFIEKTCKSDANYDLINFLINNSSSILAKDSIIMRELIKMCVELKISVVEQDEKESGLRRVLNFGHTYAHAVETITNYKKYTHGEAVVEGIRFALNLAQNRNLIDKEYKFLCENLIENFGYKNLPKYDMNKIIEIMSTDKKSTDEFIKFILPTGYSVVNEFGYSKAEFGVLFN